MQKIWYNCIIKQSNYNYIIITDTQWVLYNCNIRGDNMGIEISELMEKGTEHKKKAFGSASPDRKAIVAYLHENGACGATEVGENTDMTPKIAKTRLDVMRRDGIVDWRDLDDETYYFLTEKGTKRATADA